MHSLKAVIKVAKHRNAKFHFEKTRTYEKTLKNARSEDTLSSEDGKTRRGERLENSPGGGVGPGVWWWISGGEGEVGREGGTSHTCTPCHTAFPHHLARHHKCTLYNTISICIALNSPKPFFE